MQHKATSRGRHVATVAAVTALVLVWTGAAVAVTSGAGRGRMPWGGGMMGWRNTSSTCQPTAVSGQYVRFTAVDAGGMMGGSMYRLMPTQASVRSGEVTIDLINQGTRPHELLVFPLAAGEVPGTRTLQSNDRVNEASVIGEVAPLCSQPKDLDGIAVGNVARVKLNLKPGRYEIVCNLPGHYRVGMWAVLNVA